MHLGWYSTVPGQSSSRAKCGSVFYTMKTWHFRKSSDTIPIIRDSYHLKMDVTGITRRKREEHRKHRSPKSFWTFLLVNSVPTEDNG